MSRLLVGVTLERICKAVLLLCLLHFLIIMILYFDVYAQRLDFFSRFNVRNSSRSLPYANVSRPNGTAGPLGAELLAPSVKPVGANNTVTEKPLPPCPEMPPGLVGRLLIEFSSPMSMERVQRENPDVQEGGKYSPLDCVPRQKVAILIPFRHREHHLKYWLHYLHPILRRQKVSYGIYIINQGSQSVGARSTDPCTVHQGQQYRVPLPYSGYFGGVSGLSKTQFLKINGFPNEYWGWGGEDDDIFNRISLNGMKVSRPDARIGRYRMIKHERDRHNEPNPQRFTKIQNTKVTMKRDGIGSLQYRLVEKFRRPMYTNVTVDIGRPPPRPSRG
ncbi:PREDICTED: beta-1,4-galactosyltransferase 2 [Thamnophis sirtalis]|uniref:Beta-1,4-galactosyltransferase n=1 Tax=Thamnophis sirtalis TaxID=35019 RepID=A0A6I9XZ77_9SAUR|nr:PREDICTED: beta-1,4-galactosyltransferase 2 [Thamnophis sirtalis]